MTGPILIVEDVFDIPNRGLIVVPGPLEASYDGPRELAVRLLLPTGLETSASLRLEHLFQSPPPKENRLGCILKGVTREEVTIGTEIWPES